MPKKAPAAAKKTRPTKKAPAAKKRPAKKAVKKVAKRPTKKAAGGNQPTLPNLPGPLLGRLRRRAGAIRGMQRSRMRNVYSGLREQGGVVSAPVAKTAKQIVGRNSPLGKRLRNAKTPQARAKVRQQMQRALMRANIARKNPTTGQAALVRRGRIGRKKLTLWND